MARKKKPEEHVNHERWLVSYADFITLLFATFTALYAISNADKEKFADMAHSLRNAFSTDTPTNVRSLGLKGKGTEEPTRKTPTFDKAFKRKNQAAVGLINMPERTGLPGGDKGTEGDEGKKGSGKAGEQHNEDPFDRSDPPGARSNRGGDGPGGWMTEFRSEIEELIRANQMDKSISIRSNSRGVVVSLSESAFFEPGSSAVKPESKFMLEKVLKYLRDEEFELLVEAHTDDSPPLGNIYRDNRMLTVDRASRLWTFMVTEYQFPRDRISMAAYGAMKPIASNATAAGRLRNRRVDIVVLPPDPREKVGP